MCACTLACVTRFLLVLTLNRGYVATDELNGTICLCDACA